MVLRCEHANASPPPCSSPYFPRTGSGFFAAGWFSARSYYYARHIVRAGEQDWTGGYCDPGVKQVTIVGPSGPVTLPCTISVDEAIAFLGPPARHNTLRTHQETIDFLLYLWDEEAPTGLVVTVSFTNGKLWAAHSGHQDLERFRQPPQPERK